MLHVTCYMFDVKKRGIISMMVMCCDGDVMGYEKRTLQLSYAPLHITQDTNIVEIQPLKLILGLRLRL